AFVIASASLRDRVLQAEILRAVEQLVELAFLDAVHFVAGALDLRAAHLVARGLGLGFGIAGRLPRCLVELGASLVAVGERRRTEKPQNTSCKYSAQN